MPPCVVNPSVECEGPTEAKRWTCPVHGARLTIEYTELCRNKPDYREAWIEGIGPGQLNPSMMPQVSVKWDKGPGTELHKLLGRFGIKPTDSCPCRSRIRKMNKWGPEKCREEIETIVCWMEEEATKRTKIPIPFKRTLARQLVLRAIRTFERTRKGE